MTLTYLAYMGEILDWGQVDDVSLAAESIEQESLGSLVVLYK